MTKNIKKNIHFLNLLLNTDEKQALSLLQNITPHQIQLISEIAYNLLAIKHSNRLQKVVNKKKILLKKVSAIKTSQKVKLQIIRTHKKQLLLVIKNFIKQLTDMMK